jgi:hypothetical protein
LHLADSLERIWCNGLRHEVILSSKPSLPDPSRAVRLDELLYAEFADI